LVIPPLVTAQGTGAIPAPTGRIPVVLLPIQATVYTVGYGAVRFSPELTAASRANLDDVLRAALNESTVFAPLELPSVTAEEKAAIDEFLAVTDLVLVRVNRSTSDWVSRNGGASIDRTLGPSLAFLRQRTGADYALGTIGSQVRERGYKAVIDSALASTVYFPPSLIRNYVGLVLVDLRTGELQWFNLRTGHEVVGLRTWDLQDPESARKLIDKALAAYPQIPSLEGVTVPPPSPSTTLSAHRSSPAKGVFEFRAPDQWKVNPDTNSVQATRDGVPLETMRIVLRTHPSAFPKSRQVSTRRSTPAELADRYVAELQATELPELQVIDVSSTETLAGQPAFRVRYAFRLPTEPNATHMAGVTIGTAVRQGLLLAEFSAPQLKFFAETLPAFETSARTVVVAPHVIPR
jgi:hypothetical protein